MSRRKWTLFVTDMQEACTKIADYTSGMGFDEFCADSRTVDAVVRNLEIIGEASIGIPEEKNFRNPMSTGLRLRVSATASYMNTSASAFQ